MRLPRVRFKLGQVMVALVFVSLGLAIFTRHQRLKTLVVNQEITLKTAEANFMNAVLARDYTESAFIAYLKIDKQRLETELNALSNDGDRADRRRSALRNDVLKARAERLAKRAIWEYEHMTLARLRWELANCWRLWRGTGGARSEPSQSYWKLSNTEKTELDQRLRHFGLSTQD